MSVPAARAAAATAHPLSPARNRSSSRLLAPQYLWYRETVKNITVSVPDDVYRDARVRAAELGTSVSELVGAYLRALSGQAARFSRLEAQQQQVQGEIGYFRAGDRLDRDEVHGRAVR